VRRGAGSSVEKSAGVALGGGPLSDYVKVRTVGRGSFGEALLVQHLATGRECVLKRIRIEGESGSAAESALREALVLRRLQHPCIVEFFGAFADPRDPSGGMLCLLMGYCEGGDLQQRLQRLRSEGRRMRENNVSRWFDQLCSAVAYVHYHEVLHRDLKPSNIFLTGGSRADTNSDEVAESVALGDFGVSRPLAHALELVTTMVGTPCYLSPEVCRGKPYSYKSDIWSLGCVLFEMMALRPPFGKAANLEALVSQIVRADYAVPDGFAIEYPETIRCVRAMLQLDPERRPTAQALESRPKVYPSSPQTSLIGVNCDGSVTGRVSQVGAESGLNPVATASSRAITSTNAESSESAPQADAQKRCNANVVLAGAAAAAANAAVAVAVLGPRGRGARGTGATKKQSRSQPLSPRLETEQDAAPPAVVERSEAPLAIVPRGRQSRRQKPSSGLCDVRHRGQAFSPQGRAIGAGAILSGACVPARDAPQLLNAMRHRGAAGVVGAARSAGSGVGGGSGNPGGKGRPAATKRGLSLPAGKLSVLDVKGGNATVGGDEPTARRLPVHRQRSTDVLRVRPHPEADMAPHQGGLRAQRTSRSPVQGESRGASLARSPRNSLAAAAAAVAASGSSSTPAAEGYGRFEEDARLRQRREDRAQQSQAFREWLRCQRAGGSAVAGASAERRTEIHCPGFPTMASCNEDTQLKSARTPPLSPRRLQSPPWGEADGARRLQSLAVGVGASLTTDEGGGWDSPDPQACQDELPPETHSSSAGIRNDFGNQQCDISIGDRIEGIRACLENRMGTQRFQALYASLAGNGDAADTEATMPAWPHDVAAFLPVNLDEVLADVGDPGPSGDLAPLVAKLVACERSYFS